MQVFHYFEDLLLNAFDVDEGMGDDSEVEGEADGEGDDGVMGGAGYGSATAAAAPIPRLRPVVPVLPSVRDAFGEGFG
jgi:hypothetical protein